MDPRKKKEESLKYWAGKLDIDLRTARKLIPLLEEITLHTQIR